MKKFFFWLHIKKIRWSVHTSIVRPHYVTVDRGRFPANFIQSEKREYNDILNNYRVVLGKYQFKEPCLQKNFCAHGRVARYAILRVFSRTS